MTPRYFVSERTCIFVLSTSNGCVASVARAPADAAETEFTAVESENGTAMTAEFEAENAAEAARTDLSDRCTTMRRRIGHTETRLYVLVEYDKYACVWRVTQGRGYGATEDLGGPGTDESDKSLRQRPVRVV